MTLQKVDRISWSGFCAHIAQELAGKRVEVEIASPVLGVQLDADWSYIVGLDCDPQNDVITISLAGVEDIVLHPRELYVEFGPTGVECLGLLDHDSTWQIVLLRDPLPLPAPC